jgi:uncharacterized protein (TIGR00266 family)
MNQISKHEDISFEIKGADMQYVEVILKPSQAVISQPGTMMYMEQGVQMTTQFSDGSDRQTGLMGTIAGMGKRYLAGEDLFVTFFTNNDNVEHRVAFAGSYLGKIQAIDLRQSGGEILCQRGAFLCSAKGTSISVGINKKIGVGLFGGEGFVMQKLSGNGTVFIHACGSIEEKKLERGQTIFVDTGSLVGFERSVGFDIKVVRGVKNMMFGGEELFLTQMTGPGKIWLQSMPYAKFITAISSGIIEEIINKKK